MVTSSWTLLSILTAVVSENMISTTEEQKKLLKLLTTEQDQLEHIEELKQLFADIDANGNGTLWETPLGLLGRRYRNSNSSNIWQMSGNMKDMLEAFQDNLGTLEFCFRNAWKSKVVFWISFAFLRKRLFFVCKSNHNLFRKLLCASCKSEGLTLFVCNCLHKVGSFGCKHFFQCYF